MVGHLADELNRTTEVLVLTSCAPGAADPEYVVRCPAQGLLAYLSWILWRVPRELRRFEPDVVLSSGALVASIALFAKIGSSIPHAAILYGTDLVYSNRLYQWWLRRRLPRLNLALAISSATEGLARGHGLTQHGQVVRLLPGVDPSLPRLAHAGPIVADASLVLLFVGRLIPRKGLAPFIEHCLPLVRQHAEVELWIVGAEPAASLAHREGELAEIRRAVRNAGLEQAVRLFGEVDDQTLRSAYRAADLLVLPAIEVDGDVEGFGIVFLEAALFGVPAVATRSGGIPDAVLDGETGLLVEPGDWTGFAETVTWLLDDDVRRRELGQSARERASTELSWETRARQLRSLLQRVVRSASGGD